MAKLLIFGMFTGVVVAVIVAKTIRTVNEDERMVVFRLGQLLSIYSPGRAVLIPFLDQGVKVKVDQIEGWQTLNEDELQQRIVQAVLEKSR